MNDPQNLRELSRSGVIPESENVGAGAGRETERGRRAESPSQERAAGWLRLLWRTRRQVGKNNLSIISAGVAYYSFLALVPALVVAIAIFALVANAASVSRHLNEFNRVIPPEVMPLLQDQLTRIIKNNTAAGVSAVIGIVLACHSSASATKAMIRGMNIAYQETEKRGIIKFNAIAITLTLCEIVGVLGTLGVLAFIPMALHHIGVQNAWIEWLRWPLLVALFMIGVSILYRWGPSRRAAKWRWISWGAALAAVLWVGGSALFSYYVGKFGRYEKAYGSLGAVIVFLIWLYLSAYTILIGAQLNAELERQTERA
jgi:membrane protein